MYGIQFKYLVNNGAVTFLPDVRDESKNTSGFVV